MAAKKDDGYIRFRCRACGQKLKVRKTMEGGDVMPCPKCGTSVNVPMANLEAIAKATDMPETGQPGRLNVDPDLLMRRLQGEGGKAEGPGSLGGPPTLRQGAWSSQAAFGRVQEVDQLGAALTEIEQDAMGQVQRVFRDADLDEGQREEQVKEAGRIRREDARQLLQRRLAGLRGQLQRLQSGGDRLTPPQEAHLARLRRAAEAIRLYGRYMLGIDV
ncbi:MAG: hypothetical protein ACYS8K_08230 [Planctomycetota bacterium]|jgi:predicted RNA-binding Zn-ribbon protein involved in translation (DUF1610 family)